MGWSGGLAEWVEGETAYLSVAFSWRLPEAFQRAVWYRAQGYQVRAGGPAVWARRNYLAEVAEPGGAVEAPPEIQEMLRAYNRMRYICTDVLEPFPDMFHWDHAAYLRAWHDVTRLLAGEKVI
jgi:hypothetical protein